jgi:hypothetical protein
MAKYCHLRKIKKIFLLFSCLNMFRAKKKIHMSRLSPPPLTKICRVDFSVEIGAEILDTIVVWAEVVHAIFGILKFFEISLLKFKILKNTDLTKIICNLDYRVLMCSNKRCILVIVKKRHTQNFEILNFF